MHYVVERSHYMRWVLQALMAVLLVALIMVAFALRSWLLNNSDSTQPQMSPQKENIEELSIAIPQIVPEPEVVPVSTPIIKSTQKFSENNLNSVVLDSIYNVDTSQTETGYIEELQFQLENNQPPSLTTFNNPELEAMVKHVADQSINTKKTNSIMDIYNKVHISPQQQEDLQNTVSLLVERSMKPTDKKKPISDSENKQLEQKTLVESLNNEATVRKNEMRTIVVISGDTLSSIAKRAYGDGNLFHKIYRANPVIMNNPNRIYPGQILRVPL